LFCSHDNFLQHYRRYSNSQIVNLLKTTNYYIIANGYFFFILIFPRLVKIIKEKVFRFIKQNETTGTGLTTWKGNKFVSSFIKNFLLFDYLITSSLLKIKIKVPGLSTFVICKKSV
jgi:hypothetical protein